MKRVVIPELLDSDSGTPAEIEAALADLRGVNRRFGGTRVMIRLLEQVARAADGHLSLLDVAAATGDIARAAREHFRARGMALEATLLDRATTHLGHQFPAVAGDALQLPFAANSFDLVSCSLFAHHLEPDELVRFSSEALRVCRLALLINDLRRHWLHLGLVYAALPLFSSRLTRHDAPASVRRAYTIEEVSGLLRQSGAARVELHRYYLFRVGAIAWKQ